MPLQAVFVILLVAIALNLAVMAALIVAPYVRRRPGRGSADESGVSSDPAFAEGRVTLRLRTPATRGSETTDAAEAGSSGPTAAWTERGADSAGLQATPPDAARGERPSADTGMDAGVRSGIEPPKDSSSLAESGGGTAGASLPWGSGGSGRAVPRDDGEETGGTDATAATGRTHRRGRRFRVPSHDDPRTSRAIQSFLDRRAYAESPFAPDRGHDGGEDDTKAGADRAGRHTANPSVGATDRTVRRSPTPPTGAFGAGEMQGSARAGEGSRWASRRRERSRSGPLETIWPVDPLTGLGNRLAWNALVASEGRLLPAGEPAAVIVVEVLPATSPPDAGSGEPAKTSSAATSADGAESAGAPGAIGAALAGDDLAGKPGGEGAAGPAGAASWMPALAGALRSELRASDLLARLAPGLVAGFLSGTSGEQALVVVERVRRVAETSLASRRTPFHVRAGAADVAVCGGIEPALREAARRARLGDRVVGADRSYPLVGEDPSDRTDKGRG